MDNQISNLPASGFTYTDPELHKAAKIIIAKAKNLFADTPIEVCLHSYRHDKNEHLACDFVAQNNHDQRISVLISLHHQPSFDCWDEPEVVDMTEALHLAGLLISGLKPHKTKVGLHKNELNESLLAVPLKRGETNGMIDLN